MNLWTAAVSDVGIKKSVNQDSLMIKVAAFQGKRIGLAVICDGMGGLEKGELASSTLIKAIEKWFLKDLASMINSAHAEKLIYETLYSVTCETDKKLKNYAEKEGVQLGTTLAVLLILDDKYYIFYVGDTRVYLTDIQEMKQLTKDHTYVQMEMDKGNMTEEEAENSPSRSVLLQCVGAGMKVEPTYITGTITEKSTFLVCSDGFRHVVTKEELFANTNPEVLISEQMMEENLKYLTEVIKARKEEDNISAILVKAF